MAFENTFVDKKFGKNDICISDNTFIDHAKKVEEKVSYLSKYRIPRTRSIAENANI